MKKKLIAMIILVSVMAVYLPVSTGAASLITEISSDEFILTNAVAEQIINFYKTNPDISYQIENSTQLTGFNGDLYTYYELSPYGFAILYNQTGSLMEAYYDSNFTLPISCASPATIYYGGPGIYATYENDSFVNLVDNQILSTQTIDTVATTQNNARSILTTSLSLSNMEFENRTVDPLVTDNPIILGEDREYNVGYSYFNSLTDVPENDYGTCTVIAASIALAYYDQYLNSNFADATHIQSNGPSESFHEWLCYYVYGKDVPSAIGFYLLSKGINHYLYDRGLYYKFSILTTPNSAVIERMIQRLSSGHPVLGATSKDAGAEFNHAMLVYGVTYNTANITGTAVFRCHRGSDGNTNYLVSGTWFEDCMFLEAGADDHVYSSWTKYDDTFHKRQCSSCPDTIYLPHQCGGWSDYDNFYHKGLCIVCNNDIFKAHIDYWSESESRCTQCNRTGSCGIPLNNIIDPGIYATCLSE